MNEPRFSKYCTVPVCEGKKPCQSFRIVVKHDVISRSTLRPEISGYVRADVSAEEKP